MTLTHFVLTSKSDPTAVSTQEVGGKAFNLLRLNSNGFRVPPFLAITADAFRNEILADADITRLINEIASQVKGEFDQENLEPKIHTVQNAIRKLDLPTRLRQEIATAYTEIIPAGELVAVRSSACDEDGADHSFAGMHDSFMFVPDIGSVIDSIKNVWASAFNGRAIAYRTENGLDVKKIAVAVVVQQMIDAKSSGVIFTVNPANNRTDEIVISSVWGAGEGLVSHGLAADTFTVKKRDLATESDIAEKKRQLLFDGEHQMGLWETDVPAGQQERSSLTGSNRTSRLNFNRN